MKRALTPIVLVVLLLALTSSQASGQAETVEVGTARYLTMAKGKRSLNKLLVKMVRTYEQQGDDVNDWRLSQCFRWARNKIQCRYWLTGYGYDLAFPYEWECYGNMRATFKANGFIYSRVLSSKCQSWALRGPLTSPSPDLQRGG